LALAIYLSDATALNNKNNILKGRKKKNMDEIVDHEDRHHY